MFIAQYEAEQKRVAHRNLADSCHQTQDAAPKANVIPSGEGHIQGLAAFINTSNALLLDNSGSRENLDLVIQRNITIFDFMANLQKNPSKQE